MSYKSLLFCPDEKTARLVTQVLNELEFAVEPANEPYLAVKKLNGERFDALVADCQNEQDAALLFKTARDSGQNHSSLSVAVVEGQAGIAKAFRIGANLVLTKPINVEESKGTLRVARGLLRKNEAKLETAAAQVFVQTTAGNPALSRPLAPVIAPAIAERPTIPNVPAPVANSPGAPFSALEMEPDPTPAAEAAEVALLESLPDVSGKVTKHAATAVFETDAQPIAAGTAGSAAAVAPALEKKETIGLKGASLPPMVTNEPIVAEKRFEQPFETRLVEAPSFSSLSSATQSGGGTKFFKVLAILTVTGVAGFFGWRKFQAREYLERIRLGHASNAPVVNTSGTQPAAPPAPVAPDPADESDSISPSSTEYPAKLAVEPEISATSAARSENDDDGSIEVQELPMSRDIKSPAPAKPPLVVKPDKEAKHDVKPSLATPPPPVQVSSATAANSALSSLTTTSPALPALAPSSLRLSQGVSQGLLLKKVSPVYPPMALQMHKEGAVELLATVSKQGAITNVKVLSGDSMLAQAAVDAVRQWKYRPYLLNGEPVDIQTQITINFKAPR
jgi:TonB family protein